MTHELHQASHGQVTHPMTSPQNACFMNPYPSSQPTPGSLPQVIKFSAFQEEQWSPLYDINHQQLTKLKICVVVDKGFNYSNSDGCFVNQKKNHFQISVNIEANDENPPKFVKVDGVMHPIKAITLTFCGVKAEMLRESGCLFRLNIHAREITKVTVPRFHFFETTINNQRKNKGSNLDQKYFLLVVRLLACIENAPPPLALIQAQQSEKVIVRVVTLQHPAIFY
ncbi:NDT80/PhoG like DNA-binding family protein [Oesophagostomum dentatum]|uniref:NDT80/PhoG like DNA-binding family protein n=1 Tax=Oesophagostomum dentatum TaxID=61180 RepID=A0A0B1TSS6_OESDE|nr:NDT80/PhoG like DNA-binding family protein [Oesophagostomum dentatum]